MTYKLRTVAPWPCRRHGAAWSALEQRTKVTGSGQRNPAQDHLPARALRRAQTLANLAFNDGALGSPVHEPKETATKEKY